MNPLIKALRIIDDAIVRNQSCQRLVRIWAYLYCQIDDFDLVEEYWTARKSKESNYESVRNI